MDGANDIVKLVLPFMAGFILFSCLPVETYGTYPTASTSLLALTIISILSILRTESGPKERFLELITILFLSGIFIRANTVLCQYTATSGGILTRSASEIGRAMQDCIDRIEFQSESTNAVIKALLTGNRQDIPDETKEAFRSSGAAHILALSGLHLGIIYLLISKLSEIAGNSRNAKTFRSLLCISVCTIYSLATGAGASIIRALIFIIIRETGILLHRKPDLKTILASSIIIHLTINPADISSIGFQLSYAAIAGIAWIHPHLSAIWPNEEQNGTFMRRIWDSASVSISCQLTTGPLAWLYFGTFPQYFILTNLIAIPLTGIIIPTALTTTALSAFGICPHLLIQVTEMLINALCSALSIIGSL